MREITYVYAIGRYEGPVKVGITTDLIARLRQIQTGSAFKLQLIYAAPTPEREVARSHERDLLALYADRRLEGEWFDMDADHVIEAIETSFQVEQWGLHERIFRRRA